MYKRYRFDEPWDSPHNREVTAEVLKVFQCPNDPDLGESETSYVMVSGRGEMPSPGRDRDGKVPCPAGAEETILVVESSSARIHWAEPRDLDFADMSLKINDPARKGISSRHPKGANVLMFDGHTRYLPDSTDPATIKAMLALPGKKK